MHVSLLIPAFNEEANVGPLVEELVAFVEKTPYRVEAIIVNDGSTDGTKKEIDRYKDHHDFLISCDHVQNLGMTASLVTAFKHSSGKYLVVFPADLQYRPDCIPELLRPLEEGCDMVTGWKDGKYEKRFVSFLYNKLSRALFKQVRIHDLNSIKAMKREVFQELHLRKDWHRYMAVLAAETGFQIKEIRVKLYPRIHGASKFVGRSRVLVGLFDMLSVKFLLSFSRKPLLLFGTAGLGLISLGLALGIGAVVVRVFFHAGFRPVLYLVILLIMVGVVLFALGFIGELVVIVRERIESIEDEIRRLKSQRHPDD